MTEPEYDAWQVRNNASFAAGIGPSRGLGPEAAVEFAREQTAKLLPDGRKTAGHLLWTACHEGEPIGTLWITTDAPSPAPFIYGIEVSEELRGKGYGRSIMLAAEEECRRRGYDRLELNVFGNNGTAIALYDSLGYRVISQQMRKQF